MTVLYAQTGDTLTSYNNTELKKIANRVIRAKECDTLLSIVENKNRVQDTIITNLKGVIMFKDSALITQDSIIANHSQIIQYKDQRIDVLDDEVKKSKRKIKWIKTGWLTSTVGLIVLFIAVAL